jgi:hypothetical protein
MSHESRAAEDAQSEAHVESSDKASLDRWAQALGVTPEALESAVQAVGPRVDKIKEYLGAGGMAGDQEAA